MSALKTAYFKQRFSFSFIAYDTKNYFHLPPSGRVPRRKNTIQMPILLVIDSLRAMNLLARKYYLKTFKNHSEENKTKHPQL